VNYNALDPGIRETVKWLRGHFFQTTDSGDGVSKAELIASGYALDFPHVMMTAPRLTMSQAAYDLFRLLKLRGVLCVPHGKEGPHISATYDPADGSAVIVLTGVNDALLFPPPSA
jgi:hypothetical protein